MATTTTTKKRRAHASLTGTAFAAFMGVSRAAVWKAVSTGRVTPNADGTFDAVRCQREWRERTRLRDDLRNLPPEVAERLQAARTVRETFEARMRELNYRIRTGELVSKTQVRIERSSGPAEPATCCGT